jgi:hypothetical protein
MDPAEPLPDAAVPDLVPRRRFADIDRNKASCIFVMAPANLSGGSGWLDLRQSSNTHVLSILLSVLNGELVNHACVSFAWEYAQSRRLYRALEESQALRALGFFWSARIEPIIYPSCVTAQTCSWSPRIENCSHCFQRQVRGRTTSGRCGTQR